MLMEIHQLRYLCEVARTGSFTAAAQALHVSQSGVSAQVAKLERELGVRLFDRGARTAAPSPDGAAILPHAAAALDAVGRIRAVADDLVGVTRGQIRVGTVIGCTIPGYLAAFAEFRRRHPGVSITASEAASADLIASLTTGALDVALVAHADPLPDAFDVHTVIDEPLAVGVPADHPWARRMSIPPGALAAPDTILTLPPGTGVRAALEKTCATAGITVEPAAEVFSPDAATALAARGAGIAVLTATMIQAPLVAVVVDGSAHTSLSLAMRSEPGSAARAFGRLLRERLE